MKRRSGLGLQNICLSISLVLIAYMGLQTGTIKCIHPGHYENITEDVLDLDELEVLGAPPSLGTRSKVVCTPVAGDYLSAF